MVRSSGPLAFAVCCSALLGCARVSEPAGSGDATVDSTVDSVESGDATEPLDVGPPDPTAGKCSPVDWSVNYGPTPSAENAGGAAAALVVDRDGNFHVTGQYVGSIDFGGGARGVDGGNRSAFVVKLDSSGKHSWSAAFGDSTKSTYADDPNRAVGNSIAVDGAGDVIVVGSFAGRIDFGGGVLASTPSTYTRPDGFIAKFSRDGLHRWSQRFGSGVFDSADAVAVDGRDQVVVVGGFGGTVSFGGKAITSTRPAEIFVAKLGSDGVGIWVRHFAAEFSRTVRMDADGDILVGGVFNGKADFDGIGLEASFSDSGDQGFVLKLDGTTGKVVWAKRLGSRFRAWVNGLAVDPAKSVFVTGSFGGEADFGAPPLVARDGAFIAKLDRDGNLMWAKGYDGVFTGIGSGVDQGSALTVDSGGAIHVVGSAATGRIDFGGGPLGVGPETGWRGCAFVLTPDADGRHICSRCFRGLAL